jgi:hypothetical protein
MKTGRELSPTPSSEALSTSQGLCAEEPLGTILCTAIPGSARIGFSKSIVDTLQLPEYSWKNRANREFHPVRVACLL